MITLSTADQLDALALSIFDPQITPSTNLALGNHWGAGTGLTGQDSNIDVQLAALITEPMLTIDGRTLKTGFMYTLNVTNALQLRPKHWYLQLEELDGSGYGWPVSVALEYRPSPGSTAGGANSFGGTLGLATCACIAHTWAAIIRMWLAGHYTSAVNQPPTS